MAFWKLSTKGRRSLSRCDLMSHPEGRVYPRWSMPRHDLVVIADGSIEIREEEETFELRKGDALLLFGNVEHGGVKRSSNHLRFYFFHFEMLPGDGKRALPWDAPEADALHLPSVTSTRGFPQATRRACEEILALSRGARPVDRLRASHALEGLLFELAASHQEKTAPEDPVVTRMLQLIELETEEETSVESFSNRFQLSPRTLLTRFRKATGRNIRDYRVERKIHRACTMLESHEPVLMREVARDTGFHDEFHFSHAFKKVTGVAPSLWHRNFLAESRKVGRG